MIIIVKNGFKKSAITLAKFDTIVDILIKKTLSKRLVFNRLTLMKNINFVVSIIVIAFVATGLAVVPALELANANPDTELLKKGGNGKGKGKCGACGDYIIDEPVIKLLKGGNNKNHDKQHHHQNH